VDEDQLSVVTLLYWMARQLDDTVDHFAGLNYFSLEEIENVV
jgi:hypothetical protein